MSLWVALRDSFAHSVTGQVVYYISGRKLFAPGYEKPDYVVDEKYYLRSPASPAEKAVKESSPSQHSRATTEGAAASTDLSIQKKQQASDPDIAEGTENNEVLVTWDGPDDPSNPKNWSAWMKTLQVCCVFGLTLSAYMGTAIFTPSTEQMIAKFNCTVTQFQLGITLFVWGYGIGPVLFAPMGESPHFGGRLYVYIFTQLVFCALQLATALINHIASFAVLRFLAGFFAAAPLTTGAATLADMFPFPRLTILLAVWSLSFVSGPYMGPLIGAALTHANTWRWSFYFLLILSGGVLILTSLIMVETSEQEIFIRKARFLRKKTGNELIVSPGEIKARGATIGNTLKQLLWGPIDLCLHEPVLNFINLHLGLVYALLYLFFECFPIIYLQIYHFTNVELGLAYMSLMVGFGVAFVAYVLYLQHTLIAKFNRGEELIPEKIFVPVCILASFLMPAGIFIVGWASTYHAHWIGSMIGAALYGASTWLLFQTYVSYVGQLYIYRFASALAANTLTRSMIGGAFPLFGRFLYTNTGSREFPVGWGCSILAFLGMAMVALPVYLYIKGAELRAKAYAKYGDRDN